VTETALNLRPLCSEVSAASEEALAGTASRIEHWLLVEFGGYWPYDPLDARVFGGRLREHLGAQLASLPRSRLFLVKQPDTNLRDGVRVFHGRTRALEQRFRTLTLARHADLLELDLAADLLAPEPSLGERLDHPLLLVCTHGKRDRCCARYGVSLCEALHAHANRAWVWQTSHVGGDRFAGNVVTVPEGLYFGRVGRADVERLLRGYLDGRIALDLFRGSSTQPFHVQAAEHRVRRETGLDGFHDLRALAQRRTGDDAWTVELLAEVAGDRYEVDVEVELGDETYLTCRAATPTRPRRYVARELRRL